MSAVPAGLSERPGAAGPVSEPPNQEGAWRPFRPRFDDGGAALSRLRQILRLPQTVRADALAHEAERAGRDTLGSLRLRATALLLRDLTLLGWQVRVEAEEPSGTILVRPHTQGSTPSKDSVRGQLLFGREDQLSEEPTRRFIYTLERPSRQSSCLPVTHLIADGRRLYEQLAPVARMPREARAAALRELCRPYLQRVEGEQRDTHTGIRLMDIWRYFRHTWASRVRSMPGRNVFYLIRDAAQPYHPVMAITALGNAVMQLTVRDDWLGWTAEGLVQLVEDGTCTDDEVLGALRARLSADLAELYTEDLPLNQHDSVSETIAALRQIEQDCLRERQLGTRAKVTKVADIRNADLLAEAKTPLFRAKRARAARELLQGIHWLSAAAGTVKELLTQPEPAWAIGQALRQLKKLHSATSMMEIITCGAAPPYGHLLGGKLACLMMLSPSVIADYRARYQSEQSIIASQMAGRPVIKPPQLALLGTTSLYAERSSQYNRVVLPAGTIPGQGSELRYLELGESRGFGQPNFSRETEAALTELSERADKLYNVNFVFGEGVSPKMRELRVGLSVLGLESAGLLKHGSQRLVYTAPLAPNLKRFLLGIDPEPRYAIPLQEGADELIADYWRRRWLAARLDHQPALEALAASTPLGERVSRLIPQSQPTRQLDMLAALQGPTAKEPAMPPAAPVKDERLEFIRNLYRDESAYSDHVSLPRLRELNIATPLERALKRIIEARASVVITGNAGDGKTHLIRLLEKVLANRGAEVVQDASEEQPAVVIEKWARARAEGRPFCIAINEGPLVDLIRAYRDQHPWLAEIRERLFSLVGYEKITEHEEAERWEPQPGETVIIDLSLRQTLAQGLTRSILSKLTEDHWYEGCAACPSRRSCAVTYNRALLRTEQVQQRVGTLLERIAERGVRATFRESLAFASFLIFGGRSCETLCQIGESEAGRYYWSAFEGGVGLIFEQITAGLDPLRQTDSRLDEELWRGRFEPPRFIGAGQPLPTPRDLDTDEALRGQAEDAFAALKRRWYFEHADGTLRAATEAERLFRELKDPSLSSPVRVGRLLRLINSWWSPGADEPDALRLWTKLAYSPRVTARRQVLVSGRAVPSSRLTLYRPRLAPELRDCYGEQPEDHLLLAPADDHTAAGLRVDTRLLMSLHLGTSAERDPETEQRLVRFNEAMARYAPEPDEVRRIEILDPQSQARVTVRVDLSKQRYDSIG